MTITITREFGIDVGHRVLGHEGKCAHPHGHRYRILIEAKAPDLDRVGRVIDFSVLKERIGSWLDKEWDHAFVYNVNDTVVKDFLVGQNFRRFQMDCNPTAENMAEYLLNVVCPNVLEGTGVQVVSVLIHETPNCSAEATL